MISPIHPFSQKDTQKQWFDFSYSTGVIRERLSEVVDRRCIDAECTLLVVLAKHFGKLDHHVFHGAAYGHGAVERGLRGNAADALDDMLVELEHDCDVLYAPPPDAVGLAGERSEEAILVTSAIVAIVMLVALVALTALVL